MPSSGQRGGAPVLQGLAGLLPEKARTLVAGRLRGLCAVAAAALLAPSASSAAVGGSPHDLISQGYDVPKTAEFKDQCGSCHMPQGKKGMNFLKEVPISLASYSSESLLCFSCHDGTTLVNPNVDAGTTAFHPGSHGYDLGSNPSPVPGETGLPDSDGMRMSCVTCHDPHDNSSRPFLRLDLDELCRVCHEGLVNDRAEKDEQTGSHPVGVDAERLDNDAVPLSVQAAFRVPFPDTYPGTGGRDVPGVHWDLGGHLDGGGLGVTGCVTCHAVHGDEGTGPLTGLISRPAVRVDADEFCEGCHRGRRGDDRKSPYAPNPGGTDTARTYHPADDDEGNGTGRIVEITEPLGWPFGTAPHRPVICTSCHRPHGAETETALLREAESGRGFCGECHAALALPWHHPTGQDLTGRCAAGLTEDEEEETQGLQCDDCHRAHNAGLGSEREEAYIPILRDEITSVSFCFTCHPENDPTCENIPGGEASHFLGDPTLVDTYDKPEPPERTEPWPESGLPSLYAGETGKEVICLSCHSFRKGAVVSGDAGDTPYLLARAGRNATWDEEKGEGVYLCTGCHSATPGSVSGGRSHPMLEADITKIDPLPGDPVSYTAGGGLNCDSCHRPHAARSPGGYYILEVVGGPNTDPKKIHPVIDFTPLCHSCHGEGEY